MHLFSDHIPSKSYKSICLFWVDEKLEIPLNCKYKEHTYNVNKTYMYCYNS